MQRIVILSSAVASALPRAEEMNSSLPFTETSGILAVWICRRAWLCLIVISPSSSPPPPKCLFWQGSLLHVRHSSR